MSEALKTKRISKDEAMTRRKDVLRDHPQGTAIAKAAKGGTSYDKEKRSARFIMTSQAQDRYGDIVVTAGIQTDRFMQNPVGLLFHNSRTWPIGAWDNLEKMLKGRPPRMEGDLNLLAEGGPIKEIDETAWMLEQKAIRACSIGFIPDWDNIEGLYDQDDYFVGIKFLASELIECSVCAIPANQDALMKSVDGNHLLAKELLEDIFDNFVRSPAGLIIPRSELEETYKGVTGGRLSIIIDKSLAKTAPDVGEPPLKVRPQAETKDQAEAYIGAHVQLDPEHEDNASEDFAPMMEELKDAVGEVVDSYIVEDGERKGAHAVVVEFTKDGGGFMLRAIAGERFLTAEKGAPAADPKPKEEPNPGGADLKPGDAEGAGGDGAGTADPDPAAGDKNTGDEKKETEKSVETISFKIDTSEATKQIGTISEMLDNLAKKFDGLFSRSKQDERIEPILAEPPTPEAVEAARAKAAGVIEGLRSKGHM